MGIIQNEIESKKNQFDFEKLNFEKSKEIHEHINMLYSKNGTYAYPLWENLKDKESLNNPNGWQLIKHFLNEDKAYLLLEKAEENNVYEFNKGKEIIDLIGECFGFVFYITNDDFDYLICFNDHDYLIGCGTAKTWVESLR